MRSGWRSVQPTWRRGDSRQDVTGYVLRELLPAAPLSRPGHRARRLVVNSTQSVRTVHEMSLLEFCQWLQYSAPLIAMRASPWLFPVIATIHLMGLAVIGGAVLLVDLRLLGLGLRRQPVRELAQDAERWLFRGVAVMVATGILLFLCFAAKYYYLTFFSVKMAALFLVIVFTVSVRRRVAMADETRIDPVWSKAVALVSLSLWTTVALGGRYIGFP